MQTLQSKEGKWLLLKTKCIEKIEGHKDDLEKVATRLMEVEKEFISNEEDKMQNVV